MDSDDPFALKLAPTPHIHITESEERFATPGDGVPQDLSVSSFDGNRPSMPIEREEPKHAAWRVGPAEIWYDMLDIPPDSEYCDYGFKPSHESTQTNKDMSPKEKSNCNIDLQKEKRTHSIHDGISDDAFHMITQYQWENDIIWDGEDLKNKKVSKRCISSGWVPTIFHRAGRKSQQPHAETANSSGPTSKAGSGMLYSKFSVENKDLVYGRWEDNIIWDSDNMPSIPEPSYPILDLNDEDATLEIPEDTPPIPQTEKVTETVKTRQPHRQNINLLLGMAGFIPPTVKEKSHASCKNSEKDPFNISNDEYYSPKVSEPTVITNQLQHSTPTIELNAPFIPTHLDDIKLRQFSQTTSHKVHIRSFVKSRSSLGGLSTKIY